MLNSEIFQLSQFGWTTLPSLRQQLLFAIANILELILKFQLLMFTQNGVAEYLIKQIQVIVRPILLIEFA